MARDGGGPDFAFVAGDDAGDDGEANPRAFEFLFGVETLEELEKLVGIFGIEADARILHLIDMHAVLGKAL